MARTTARDFVEKNRQAFGPRAGGLWTYVGFADGAAAG